MSDFMGFTDAPKETEEVVEAVEAEEVSTAEETSPAPKARASKKQETNNVLFKRGDSGSHVKKMQECLNTLGFTCPETGRFCVATETALKGAQKQSGLEENGKLDEATCALICK